MRRKEQKKRPGETFMYTFGRLEIGERAGMTHSRRVWHPSHLPAFCVLSVQIGGRDPREKPFNSPPPFYSHSAAVAAPQEQMLMDKPERKIKEKMHIYTGPYICYRFGAEASISKKKKKSANH